uniref:Uncharacterized protein n=1 Tax=Colletotrichum fructicola (strain Nara gc5) TaxID=1213859 RepID=L2FV94_COLFN
MVAEEQRQARERERRDAEEAKRITKMLEKEDKERRRKEAEIERETERLRRLYGVPPAAPGPGPGLPPRHQPPPGSSGGSWHVAPAQPPRPSSAGPYNQGQPGTSAYRPPQQQQGGRGKLPNLVSGLLQGPYGNTAASVSNFFHRDRAEEERKAKIAKKRSVHF